mgnify:CR=1 FL=1
MASVTERVSVLETQVLNIEEKIDDIKDDVKELDEKIVIHNNEIKTQLKTMYDASCTQHSELAKKIGDIEKFKAKWTYMVLGGVAVAGYMAGHLKVLENLLK